MPLYAVISRNAEGVSREEVRAGLKEHLVFQFESEARGKLFAAGPFGPLPETTEGIYFLWAESEAEAREIAERDPFHRKGLRVYRFMSWRLHESSILGVGLRARLNGDDPSNPHYWPPKD